MAISDKRRRMAALLWKRLRIVALLILVALATSAVWGIYQKERESRQMRADAERRLQELTGEQQTLQKNIAKLESARGKEEVLREQYAVGKPGEQMMVIVEPQRPQPVATTTGILDFVHKFLPFW